MKPPPIVGYVNRITVTERIKHHFWYEGPLGPNYQFWKGSRAKTFIGQLYKPKKQNGCLFRQKSDYLNF